MKYKSGVIGCGRMGFGFDKDPRRKHIATHAGAYKFLKSTDLTCVSDVNKKNLAGCADTLNVSGRYGNFKEMLSKEKIDILSICTPPHTHYAILKEAVKFPVKAIFCEKPLAEKAKDARRMVEVCRKKNIILQVGHQRRFDALHGSIKKFIADKKLGRVQQVNFYYTAGIRNTGTHMFDLLRFLFGDAKWVEGMFSKNPSRREKDPNIDGILKFKRGILATFQALDVEKYLIFELDSIFEKGRLVLKNSGFSVDFYVTGESKYYSGYRELRKARSPFRANYKRDFMVNAVRHLVECVKKQKDSVSSGEDGLRALEIVENAIYSAKHNGKKIFLR